jgi:glycosyltransferase involved in cell wall biosynthesis
MIRGLFALAAALVGYTYVGFPMLVLLRSRLRPRDHRSAPITPRVSLIIAARNEEAVIAGRIENALSLDYPADLLEVIVASDGSEDATVALVRACADPRVRVLDLPRVGKDGALAAAAEDATGQILVFSDANSAYAPDALRQLVAPFADPSVGGVAGDQRYLPDDGREAAVATGERGYWDLDRALKLAESRAGNVISATGAIYAVRRSLFRPPPPGVTDDFAISTAVIAQGQRLVFAPDAVAYEPVARSGDAEFARKVRVMTRGLNGVVLRRELLDPRRHGFYAVQLFSHKVLRRLMAVPLSVLAATSLALSPRSWLFRVLAAGQVVVYGLGALGIALGRRGSSKLRLLALPAYFLMVNAASVNAAWNVARGKSIERWEPQRDPEVTV